MLSFRKNYEPIPRILTDRRKDRRQTDGQTLFHRTFPTAAGGPKKSSLLYPSASLKYIPYTSSTDMI